MCGIITVILSGTSTPTPEEVKSRLLKLKHRGPDHQSVVNIGSSVIMGHARLSIVDVAGGSQPFRHRNMAMTVNGEIYNTKRLRESTRFPYSTESDCEVIMPLVRSHYTNAMDKLDGQFAFVWVETDPIGNLMRWMAARDRIGIRPLYTCLDIDGNRWFASEIKALQHLTEHIVHVPPGHMMTGCGVVSAKMVQSTRPWYKPDWMSGPECWMLPDDFGGISVLRGAVYQALEESVRARLMVDESCVEVGAFLSGGIDSSIVAAIAAKILWEERGITLKTFCISLAPAAKCTGATLPVYK